MQVGPEDPHTDNENHVYTLLIQKRRETEEEHNIDAVPISKNPRKRPQKQEKAKREPWDTPWPQDRRPEDARRAPRGSPWSPKISINKQIRIGRHE